MTRVSFVLSCAAGSVCHETAKGVGGGRPLRAPEEALVWMSGPLKELESIWNEDIEQKSPENERKCSHT